MPESKAKCAVVIRNEQGLHMRPAEQFVRTAAQFDAKIDVVRGSLRVDGKSMLDIFTLAAEKDTEITIEAIGADADAAVAALVKLIEGNFNKPAQDDPQ
jgi:phosphotransferase system HPr (HPr) family protein